MQVIKRDGTKEEFNKYKIIKALEKAFLEIDEKTTSESLSKICMIADSIEKKNKILKVEEIQDIIEEKLMASNRKDVAKIYILYRAERTKEREKNSSIIVGVSNRVNAKNIQNSNANVDESSFSGREKEASADIGKTIALEFDGLSKEVAKAHKDMLVYQHDLEKAIYGIHNCLQVEFQEIFKNGFATRNGDVRPPSNFATACQLIAVVFQCQSQVQFGGVGTIHLDYDLAPFVKKSFIKHFQKGLIYILKVQKLENIEEIYIDNEELKEKYLEAYEYAIDMLEEEGNQSAEGLYHNLNTLESRQGSQVPFTSINLGRDTSTEGRLVTKWIMKASLNGIGKFHLTPIFPISIFQHKKGCNAKKGDKNYDLKQLALKSMSKRIYPNWVNCDWSNANETEGDIMTLMSTMGCRTLIGYDRHGYGYIRTGRGNNVPNTIILPKLGIEYGICLDKRESADLKGFWKALEDALKLCEKGLLERYEIIKKQSPKSAPFMYKNGTILNADKCIENVEESVKHGSLAIGLIGMAEMCQALFGKNHAESEEVHKFALSVVKRFYTFAEEASNRNDLNFGVYFTPAEGLCHKSVVSLRKQYGDIKNVTDREYLTNSIHVPVWQEVDIFTKLKIEAPFTKYATSGCITYVELDSMFVNNIEAIEKIINYAFDELDIPYLAFNFPIDTCLECGHQDEIINCCPQCGSDKIQRLRRVTGYLTSDYKTGFNNGKIAETEDRIKHSLINK